MEEISLKERYNKLDSTRNAVLERARTCSEMTIPSLMPPDGSDQNTTLETPYQALGARGVNNLASKLLLTLLPPNRPFFRLTPNESIITEMEQVDSNVRSETERKLAEVERTIMKFLELKAARVDIFYALKLLVCTGNALVQINEDGTLKIIRLDNYVVKRDTEGNLLECIILEKIAPKALPEDIRDEVMKDVKEDVIDEPLELFTRYALSEDGRMWEVQQECNKVYLKQSEGTYKLEALPIMALRWTKISGEDYGRGHVEEYLGDLFSLEGLSKAMIESTMQTARTIWLLNPAGVTRAKDIAEATNGAVVKGNREDVAALQVDKFMDFKITLDAIARLEQRLSHAFLLTQGIQRNAERVTASEIRIMSQELENALGGIYTVLSNEFQRPFVELTMQKMQLMKKIPKLDKDLVEPAIVTGIDALGRGHDLEKLTTFIQGIAPLGESAMQFMNIGTYITNLATSLGIDSTGLVYSQEELQAQQQQNMMGNMVQQAVPGMLQESMKQTGGGEGGN